MKNYLELLNKILEEGEDRKDRTGTGTLSLFGEKLSFDLQQGFPLVTTKKVHFKSIVYELLWILRGDTNIKWLNNNGVTIWNEWADENGNLGPTYGFQMRNFNGQGIDQLNKVINLINNDPHSRRIIMTLTNPTQEAEMKLPPCISMYQFYVSGQELSMQVYQRSCDFFLGGPFDIAQGALLLSLIAKVTNKLPRKLKYVFGDVHLYKNHLNQAKEQLTRTPKYLPTLLLSGLNIMDFKFEDIQLLGYESWPSIKAEVAK